MAHTMRRVFMSATLAVSLPAILFLRADTSANGQSASGINAAIRKAVIDQTVDALSTTYVDIDAGQQIGAQLERALADGAYDQLDRPAQFATAVTTDMRRLNGDLHLSLRYAPTSSAPASQTNPASINFGIGTAEMLDHNIGYIAITGFAEAPGYETAVVAALKTVEQARAVIIDLRANHGGSSGMSHFIFSHFLGATPVPTINVRRRDGALIHRRSLAQVPGPRRPDVPLYVLTSRQTASAAEEFCFVLRNLGRATLVGSRTAGAGRMVTRVPVGHGFVAGISITSVTDPVSGREWETVGVQPHIDVAPADALEVARSEALKKTP